MGSRWLGWGLGGWEGVGMVTCLLGESWDGIKEVGRELGWGQGGWDGV